MAFCENCGTKLAAGDLFCGNCGEKVLTDSQETYNSGEQSGGSFDDDLFFSLFESSDWQHCWKNAVQQNDSGKTGIILTRERALLNELDETDPDVLHCLLKGFADIRASKGIRYYYLDLDACALTSYCDGSASEVVKVLQKIKNTARPDCLFILGNEKIIGTACWEDKTGDDMDIDSDWCYVSCDAASLWECRTYDFETALRVGRLPVYPGESFEEFQAYFYAATAADPGFRHNYALSASCWQRESDHEYRSFGGTKVDLSPEVTVSNAAQRFSEDTNFFYFNLHGSDENKSWFGQEGRSYPEAISPEAFEKIGVPYVLGVEACYGARYTGGLTADDSILLKAITNNCISFLGSSRIAYGTPEPPGSCADIVVGEFLRQLSGGETAGDAFILAMKKLVSSSKELDDAELKTLAEFALYGDPAVCIAPDKKKSLPGQNSKGFLSGLLRTYTPSVNLPDVRMPVRMELTRVNEQIERSIDDFIFATYFGGIRAKSTGEVREKLFRLPNLNLNQKVFSRRQEHFSQIVKVYFDDRGSIKKVYESK